MRSIKEFINIKQLRATGKIFLSGCITAFVITYIYEDIILPLAVCFVLMAFIIGEEDLEKINQDKVITVKKIN